MKRSKTREAIVATARKMPPLYHTLPDQEFSWHKSRTLWWLTKQPAALKYLWDIVKQSGAIQYDHNSGKWVGVDFESSEEDE